MKIQKTNFKSKNSQAVIVEFLFIAIILGILFGAYSTLNPISSGQVIDNNNNQDSDGITTLFLHSNSSLYVQELIRTNTPLNHSDWENITTFIEQRFNANIYVLNNDTSINNSLRNCPISRFNNQLLSTPIFVYDSSTYSIETTKYFQIKLCRGN
ncbi:MAG: hypothetical protein ACLFPL_04550 [Candidatus Nanoarchaeia archaeon]